MAQPHQPPPLETLRDAIAEALWGAVSAPALPAACVALGLREGDSAEAMNSKRKYAHSRITTFKGQDLLALAHRVVEAYGAADLADYVSELTTHADYRITDLIRRAVLAELFSAGELFGDLQRAGYLPCADYTSDTRDVTTAASIKNQLGGTSEYGKKRGGAEEYRWRRLCLRE